MNSCADALPVAMWLMDDNKTVFYTFRKSMCVDGSGGSLTYQFKHILNFQCHAREGHRLTSAPEVISQSPQECLWGRKS